MPSMILDSTFASVWFWKPWMSYFTQLENYGLPIRTYWIVYNVSTTLRCHVLFRFHIYFSWNTKRWIMPNISIKFIEMNNNKPAEIMTHGRDDNYDAQIIKVIFSQIQLFCPQFWRSFRPPRYNRTECVKLRLEQRIKPNHSKAKIK